MAFGASQASRFVLVMGILPDASSALLNDAFRYSGCLQLLPSKRPRDHKKPHQLRQGLVRIQPR